MESLIFSINTTPQEIFPFKEPCKTVNTKPMAYGRVSNWENYKQNESICVYEWLKLPMTLMHWINNSKT